MRISEMLSDAVRMLSGMNTTKTKSTGNTILKKRNTKHMSKGNMQNSKERKS